MRSLPEIINGYNPSAPLAQASTIPSAWYTDPRVFELEKQTVFTNSWHFAARADQLQRPGDYVTTEIAGEPIVLIVGADSVLRGFFNVCRHHAAAVMTEPAGNVTQMRCPYHGWTYSLDSVLDYGSYAIENGKHFCLQSSPMIAEGAETHTGAVRKGDRARYYWIYPDLMINCYADTMDTNVVVPLAVNKTAVIFDFYFADVSPPAREHNVASVNVGERIQQEDLAICESVQRGLSSRAYDTGRLSVRREAGEHLFHRLLHADLLAGIGPQ